MPPRPPLTAALVAGAVATPALAAGAVGWRVSDMLRDRALRFPERTPATLRVVADEGDALTLEPTGGGASRSLADPVVMGLQWAGGYAQLAAPDAVPPAGGPVRRRVIRRWGGDPGPAPARLNEYAYPDDPAVAHGLARREPVLRGAAGAFPAWEIPGAGDTWVIMVHGLGGTRGEGMRALGAVARAGVPALLTTYRGAREGPVGDGLARHGLTEWADVEVAVAHAQDAGARRVVLFGWSMGGAIALAFVQRSPLAHMVAGLLLDSPMLDLRRLVTLNSGRVDPRLATGAGRVALRLGRAVAGRRFGLDWDALDRRMIAAALDVPLVLAHGGADRLVPVTMSDELAARHGDMVAYLRPPGVDHVRTWNADPETYDAAVTELLARVEARR